MSANRKYDWNECVRGSGGIGDGGGGKHAGKLLCLNSVHQETAVLCRPYCHGRTMATTTTTKMKMKL